MDGQSENLAQPQPEPLSAELIPLEEAGTEEVPDFDLGRADGLGQLRGNLSQRLHPLEGRIVRNDEQG